MIVQWILRPLYIEFLRGFVSLKQNWLRVFRMAYFDHSKIQDDMVYAYMMPKLVRNWETGLFNFSYSKIYRSAKQKREKKGKDQDDGYKPVTWL